MSDLPLGAVISSGVRHAVNYARVMQARTDFELAGVFEDPVAPEWAQADARRVADVCGLPLLESIPDDVALVLVCSEPTRHARCATSALTAGHHVLVDKPVATTGADAARLVEVAESAGVVCAVVNRTVLPSVRRARAAVEAGRIGFPRSVDVEFLADGSQFGVAVERPELVVDPELSGGGEVMNFMGYCIDAIRSVTGCEPVEVQAWAASSFSAAHRDAGVEDIAVISALFTHGVVATITVGRPTAAPTMGAASSTMRIIGSHGHLVVDDDSPAVTLFDGDGGVELVSTARGESLAMTAILDDVRDAIVLAKPLRYDVRDASIAVAAIDAAYESIATGLPTRVRALDDRDR